MRVNGAILEDLLAGDYRDPYLHEKLGEKYGVGKCYVIDLATGFCGLLDQFTEIKKSSERWGNENASLKREMAFLRKYQPQLPTKEEWERDDAKEREAFAMLSDETKKENGL